MQWMEEEGESGEGKEEAEVGQQQSGALVGSRPNDRRRWPVTAVVSLSMP
jgi:hypothetical protein